MDPDDRDDALSTVLRARFDPTGSPETSYTLLVIEGPDVGAKRTIDGYQPSRVLVGQSHSCELRLTDREVSRRHLAIDVEGRRLRVTDLGSKNGTFVDGTAIVDAYLRGGEIVRIGATAIRADHGPAQSGARIPSATSFGGVLGASAEMRRLYPLCEKLAASRIPVVIEGETGTGKEALAEALHEKGPRAAGPFVVFDCTSSPPNLVESELFGHERGAFTGAIATRKGVFEQAQGGTLLIDEIGDLDPSLQPKLLRVLERSELRRVGGGSTIRLDVRILAATRRDLDREVQARRFRDDLFHRLAVARIELPPLRSRRGDIAILAAHFWASMGGEPRDLPAELLRRWTDAPWPGNVRELRNAVARRLALGDAGETAERPDQGAMADAFAAVLERDLALPRAKEVLIEAFERRYVERALERHGSVAKAAAASGVAKRYFQLLRARKDRDP